MDKIQKFLQKLRKNERGILTKTLQDIRRLKLEGYDIKVLKGFKGIYRLRKRNFRIIFYKKEGQGFTLELTYRKDAYK